jgi:hypothetical protein
VADAVTCEGTRVAPVRGRPVPPYFSTLIKFTRRRRKQVARLDLAPSLQKDVAVAGLLNFSLLRLWQRTGPSIRRPSLPAPRPLAFGGLEEAMPSMKQLVCRVLEAPNECVTESIALQDLAKAETDKALFLLASKKLRDCSNCPKSARQNL